MSTTASSQPISSGHPYRLVKLSETTSTNSYLHTLATQLGKEEIVVTASYQSAGRGQAHNHWESEPGKNLLFSLLTHPQGIFTTNSFLLSMAHAVAIAEELSAYCHINVALKWPNDIYFHDQKLGGTLIETTLSGKNVSRCIFGTGLNVNQTVFQSSAPNPVSLAQITGKEWNLDELFHRLLEAIHSRLIDLEQGYSSHLIRRYHELLYRRQGFHLYEDAEGVFEACIVEVLTNGRLVLLDRHNHHRIYELKEVKILLPTTHASF